MASAKKLPSGNWRVLLFVGKGENGKREYKSFTAPTKREAEAAAALYSIQKQKKQESGLTVAESIEEYIKTHENLLSPATIRKYRSMQKNAYTPIEGKFVSSLSSSDIQAFVNAFALDHAPKTVNCVCGLLTASLKASDPERSFVFKRPSPRRTQIQIPTQEQVKTLIKEAGSPAMTAVFVLAAALGLRRSEIAALTWQDIDDDVLHITKALVQDKDGNWIVKGTKTDAGTRDLELPDYVTQQLLSLKSDEAKQTERIFSFSPDAITMRFNRAREKAGVSCRFHDLRHYNASVMLALGIPDKYAMERMGHSTPNMLKTVYQHLIDTKKQEVAAQMNQAMKSIIS
jgi:integrase